MNVAIFTDNDSGKINGVTTSLRAALAHAPAGICPRIYTASDLEIDRHDYFSAASIGTRIPFYADVRMYLPRVLRFLREAERDRVEVIHMTTPGPVGLAALYVARRLGVRMVGSFHTDLAAYTTRLSGSTRLGALMREYLRWPYGRCDRVLVPSDDTRQMLTRARVAPGKLALWRRGVDSTLFDPAKRSAALRERWRVCDRRPAVIYVGRLSPEKGLAMLPAIQSALHRRGAEHRLILVGNGPMRQRLKEDLPDAVLTGALPPEEVAVAMASADLFLSPSDTDAAGNAVLEAQASGLPVAVSSAGGPKEYILPGASGVVCRAGDPESFAREAAHLLRNVRPRIEMSRAAQAHGLTLRWDVALEPLYRAYLEVAACGSRPAHARPASAAQSRA